MNFYESGLVYSRYTGSWGVWIVNGNTMTIRYPGMPRSQEVVFEYKCQLTGDTLELTFTKSELIYDNGETEENNLDTVGNVYTMTKN